MEDNITERENLLRVSRTDLHHTLDEKWGMGLLITTAGRLYGYADGKESVQ